MGSGFVVRVALLEYLDSPLADIMVFWIVLMVVGEGIVIRMVVDLFGWRHEPALRFDIVGNGSWGIENWQEYIPDNLWLWLFVGGFVE